MLTFLERSKLCVNPTSKKLFQLMAEKETNLAVNPDVTSSKELLKFADLVGPHICILKTHIDILSDFTPSVISALQELAAKHRFLLFEDRKFSDIGSVVKMQYEAGIYQIAQWADIVNAHPIPGPGVINGLREAGLPLGRGLLLLAEMSSSGTLAKGKYTEAVIDMAHEHDDFVIGFISQRKLSENPRLIHMTPGVKLSRGTDSLGQQYNTPWKVVREQGTDVIIVGRGIIRADDPASEAARYREEGIKALNG